jgi:cysteine desulfurase
MLARIPRPNVPLIYLDNAATTPLDPAVREAMRPWLDGTTFGNPSSRHRLGVRAAEALEAARGQIGRAVGARSSGVTFTSGGTEANVLAVVGGARARAKRGRHVVIGPTEHPCVRRSGEALVREGFEVEHARLAADGSLDLDDLAARLRPDTVVVAQMLANNEFGSVYPCRRVARLVRARAPQALVHVDAVQAFGKAEVSLVGLGADTLALSGHKVNGPQGAGALVRAAGVLLEPVFHGGGQEGGLRSGTENVAAAVGFGCAAELADREACAARERWTALRARLVAGLEALPGARVLAPGGERLPSIVAASFAGAPSEVLMHHLEEKGVVVSAGSACQSRKKETSPGMLALGLAPEEARRVLRFSFGRQTTEDEVACALEALGAVCRELAGVG